MPDSEKGMVINMKKSRTADGRKNLISDRLVILREQAGYSQADLAERLQLKNINVNENMIAGIETNSRYVSDFELKAFTDIFGISFSYLFTGVATAEDLKKYPEL